MGESLLQVIRGAFAVRKNHKTGGNLGILHEKMIWTLFRIINLHPMQISITSQAIRKSLKRASTRSESHRAIVHFYYVFHSAYSYLSFFLADRVSISYPHTFWEISKIFAAMAGVSRIGVKNWVDGRVDGGLLGKPASPCAPGVSAGSHRVLRHLLPCAAQRRNGRIDLSEVRKKADRENLKMSPFEKSAEGRFFCTL